MKTILRGLTPARRGKAWTDGESATPEPASPKATTPPTANVAMTVVRTRGDMGELLWLGACSLRSAVYVFDGRRCSPQTVDRRLETEGAIYFAGSRGCSPRGDDRWLAKTRRAGAGRDRLSPRRSWIGATS